jgi:hypothetical protein
MGLGTARRADRVEIRWPSGLVEVALALAADRFYVAREGSGIASEASPRATPAPPR